MTIPNQRQLDFEEFTQILSIFLFDKNEFNNNYSLDWMRRSKTEISTIFAEYDNSSISVPVDSMQDFFTFFLSKAKGRDFVKSFAKRDLSFDALIEDAIGGVSQSFKGYMIFLKKNQHCFTLHDFIRIGTHFGVLNFPKTKELPLLETEKSKDALQLVMTLVSETYEDVGDKFRAMSETPEKVIGFNRVFQFMREVFHRHLKFIDSGIDLLEREEEESLAIYLRVYLFDYLRLDSDYYNSPTRRLQLELSQILDFIRFLIQTLETLEVVKKVYNYDNLRMHLELMKATFSMNLPQ